MPRYFLRSLLVVVSCLLLIVATMLLQPTRASFATSASISLSLSYGPPTSSIQVRGRGFKRRETVTLFFDTTLVRIVTASTTGSFSSTITVPVSAHFGSHFVLAKGKSSRMSARATFLVQTDWTQFGFDSQHTHFNPYENMLTTSNVSGLALDWSYATSGSISSSPAIVNGIVYVGSQDDNLYALSAATGSKLWSYTTGGFIQSSPTVANEIVYVGSNDGHLYALNATTGAILWNYRDVNGSPLIFSPIALNNTVYAGFADGNIYALNATTGAILWSCTTGKTIGSSSAVVNGVMYIGVGISLYALNATTGTILWSYTTGNAIVSSPAVVNGIVYVGSSDNKLYALNAKTGTILWSYTTNNGIGSSPAVANGVVYFSNNDITYALNAKTGILLWSSIGVGAYSSLAIANGVAYSGAYSGVGPNVYALNAASGAILWSYTTGNAIVSSPAIANGIVYVGSSDNKLYAFHLPSMIP